MKKEINSHLPEQRHRCRSNNRADSLGGKTAERWRPLRLRNPFPWQLLGVEAVHRDGRPEMYQSREQR
jgi:hypothetical protein